jgi:hypothetical protein
MKRRRVLKSSYAIIYLLILLSPSYAQTKNRGETIVLAWNVQIVDEAGNPVKGVLVRQTWQDYDVEREGHKEDVRSDENGYAKFPKRTIRYDPKKKAKARAKNIARLGVHASLGLHAQIWGYGADPHIWSFVTYEEGKPLPERIVLKRWSVAIYP